MTEQKELGYLDIASIIKNQIVAGVYNAREKLPSVRELARMYRVNQKTIQRTIKYLEQEGIVNTQAGIGVFVQGDIEVQRTNRSKEFEGELRKILISMQAAGLKQENVKSILKKTVEEVYKDEN